MRYVEKTQAMAAEIKEQVLAELNHPGFQAYRQLVEAVRGEILSDLKTRRDTYPELVAAVKKDVLRELNKGPAVSGSTLSPAEIEAVKSQIIQELRQEQEY